VYYVHNSIVVYMAVVVVKNLKQLTYCVPGTFKFNKSNFICNRNAEGRDGRGGARKMNSPVYFFITFDDCRAFYVCPGPPHHNPYCPCFLFIFFILYFTLFRLVSARSLTFEQVPRELQRPVRANNTRKLHWDSFYLVLFFSG